MSSRRSARASTGKRLSYREDSDGDDAGDLTEDEYQQDRGSTSADDAVEEDDPSEEDSDEQQQEYGSKRSPKRRKHNPTSPAVKRGAASSGAAKSEAGDGWEPGVTRVVAKLVGPPQSGHVARGELSPNVLTFLQDLQDNNDRDWFARYDAVYRYAWKNFGEFTEAVLNDIMEKVDDTVPWLPTKDLVYRIYRDVRFSNDKTPYKTNLMASFSRGGRKGPFAGYHVLIKPGGRSFFAAGRWQPEREDLAVIRQHILDDTPEAQALKAAVSEPGFIKWYGAPKGQQIKAAKTKGKAAGASQQRSNLWGCDDELKVAPKIAGVDKTHKDIDWLKLRSFVVIHNLNSMTSPDPSPPPESGDEGDEDQENRQNGHHANQLEEEEEDEDKDEELLPTESFDYVDDEDGDDDDNDNDSDEED
uniref:Uncharacterized protein n=1 Tax=Kalmanozyma brasiliensis (strain GHG001) TaxID=1365824 RepID=V5EF00_KALBG